MAMANTGDETHNAEPHDFMSFDEQSGVPLFTQLTINFMKTGPSYETALAYVPRDNDVFVTTYARSGTTMILQTVYQMVTGGDMNFKEMNEVVPWIEVCSMLGQKLNDDFPKTNPRVFKTHLSFDEIPKRVGGQQKYIYMYRNPEDVVVSYFHFITPILYAGREPDFEDTFNGFLYQPSEDESPNYFRNVASWLEHLNDPNVLVLIYEDTRKDRELTLKRIAKFLSTSEHEYPTNPQDPLFEMVMERSSFEYMKKHESHFGDRMIHVDLKGMPKAWYNMPQKIRTGAGSNDHYLNDSKREQIRKVWGKWVGSALGLGEEATYEDVNNVVRKSFAAKGLEF
ncbi:P-loop containing nucleoside triphosphate hydrolase protein [Basidiobolus meristosporus CBS 931.73]|uniref:p-loop containing nucleoside triphosphate hydrolase protein n=1 Tax=Basidiobolus meristosporus CBS 931.73 TaxID=1314790 RepID=A0A1Y1YT75_9FUNG|nr:P-loop containing nucleoside triphosphate hydrolase protein [Basidiobolus meristosporus CBS 931.73]|eukprot:ORY00775.1 P-loop containing nucleoside triphosphate hydrolase protein [Basidiobolus meristosporus CBS 931.73]